jgi:hypothetical protein
VGKFLLYLWSESFLIGWIPLGSSSVLGFLFLLIGVRVSLCSGGRKSKEIEAELEGGGISAARASPDDNAGHYTKG